MSGGEIGGNRRERHHELGKLTPADVSIKEIEQPISLDEAASQADIEQAEDASAVQRKRPCFELLDATGGECRPDHRAHRATRDDIGDDAVIGQRANHADMRPPARRAAAERQPEFGSRDHRCRIRRTPLGALQYRLGVSPLPANVQPTGSVV